MIRPTLAAVLLCLAALAAPVSPAQPAEATMQDTQSGPHDFDFWMGHWSVHHRQLKQRLANSHDWLEFGGTSTAQAILGGAGNIDDNVIEKPGTTYRAVTMRSFDPKTSRWSIWWLDGRFPDHLDPPLVGSFKDGVGTFYADDTFEGKPIRVRFIWSRTREASPRWEQAFSEDGGKTWETNWICDHTRAKG